MAATVGDQEPSPASFDSSSIMSDDSCFNMDPGITAGIRKRESLDTHNHNKTSYEVKRYKSRMIHSKHKLENFFGQSIPIDVNIAEIETHGLKAMLQSKVPLCYFLYSMLEELCSENLVIRQCPSAKAYNIHIHAYIDRRVSVFINRRAVVFLLGGRAI